MINRRIFQRSDFVSWLLWSSRKQSSSRSSSSSSVSVSWMSALSLSTSGSEQDLNYFLIINGKLLKYFHLSCAFIFDRVFAMFNIRPTFFHFLIRRLGKTLVISSVSKSASTWLGHLVFPFEALLDDLMLLSSEALRRRNLSSKIIFLLAEMLWGFWSSSSHQARALNSSFLLFWYFLEKEKQDSELIRS